MELKEEGNYRKLRLATAAAHSSADGQKHLFNSPYDARSSKGRLRTVAVSSLPGKWNSGKREAESLPLGVEWRKTLPGVLTTLRQG